jgi:hypothetical protein
MPTPGNGWGSGAPANVAILQDAGRASGEIPVPFFGDTAMNALVRSVLVLALAAPPMDAQSQMGSTQRAAIDKLAWIEGEWRGDAWMMTGPNERHAADQTERIYRAAGGTVLVIHGLGKAKTQAT